MLVPKSKEEFLGIIYHLSSLSYDTPSLWLPYFPEWPAWGWGWAYLAIGNVGRKCSCSAVCIARETNHSLVEIEADWGHVFFHSGQVRKDVIFRTFYV